MVVIQKQITVNS
ncbi:hypothetical protein FWK35_00021108 [Aphis craccivora]|uniref:Uncharacterized protein n=1 Tax=Aphis craccivora TaxID=307492 RepID=A0A6G0YIG8_APHCR|nr:hypothetical protein FWK35_00021108 [Aphis craccivora]